MSDITLTLTRAEAQTILDALATQPYGQVYQLVPKLIQQAEPNKPRVVEDAEEVSAS